MDFSVINKAGLTQGELAWLCGVSRVTANKWLNGKGVHFLLEAQVSKTLNAVSAAIDHEILPNLDEPQPVPKYGMVRTTLKQKLAPFLV